jgi:segregation and condensation protein B
MDYFGINSTDDLPKIKEVLAEQTVQGTLINNATDEHVDADLFNELETSIPAKAEDTGTTLIVADTGELIEQPLLGDAADEVKTQPETSRSNAQKDNDENVKRSEDVQDDDLNKTSQDQPKEDE